MQTYHIHIEGLVQGVGFRPFVKNCAEQLKLNGIVNNATNGVHVYFNADENNAQIFFEALIKTPPLNAIVTSGELTVSAKQEFNGFQIEESEVLQKTQLLPAPDIGICEHCTNEITDKANRRYQYAFITCLNCGPRYSITKQIPYDRINTTMSHLEMCEHCKQEYRSSGDNRFYSQSNSCPDCAIPMSLHTPQHQVITSPSLIFETVNSALKQGEIVAVKAIGGYLLLCDATNKSAVELLRKRKQRPNKPFAVLMKDIETVNKHVVISLEEEIELTSPARPIVICSLKSGQPIIAIEQVAPQLNSVGVMLPCAPLLTIIANNFDDPLVATSANCSGETIIYKEKDAFDKLPLYADYILNFDREIITPQDDSVIQFSPKYKKRIVLRRSRGFAPNYFPNMVKLKDNVLACGADMKSAFALTSSDYLYISQHLGDLSSFDAQLNFESTYEHLSNLLAIKPKVILVDKHPDYYSRSIGEFIAKPGQQPVIAIQHHHAHAAAVMAENHLFDLQEDLLCVVWDGTGYGDDGKIWGGEFFTCSNSEFKRACYWKEYTQLLGDKMSKEPRLSALSMLKEINDTSVHDYFSPVELDHFSKQLNAPNQLKTTSTGRIIDAVAAILGLVDKNTFEGEAAMKLEAIARQCETPAEYYPVTINNETIQWHEMIAGIVTDKEHGIDNKVIAGKFFHTLVRIIRLVAQINGSRNIAFSGGVFQNGLLTDLIIDELSSDYNCYFHQFLSPNDECIAFGQLAYYKYVLNENKGL